MAFSRTYSTPVDPSFGFDRIEIRCDIPELPRPAHLASFAYHQVDPGTGMPGDRVVATYKGGLALSNDLGDSWDIVELSKDALAVEENLAAAPLQNAFITDRETLLVQVKAPMLPPNERSDDAGKVLRFDRHGKLECVSKVGQSHWHGTRTIDQAGDVIMFAEYPSNKQKYTLTSFDDYDPARHDIRTPGVYRSRDDGRSWERVFEISWHEIRHFHTVAADPHMPGVWWLSSGDQPSECRVWRSEDDGDTWADVSLNAPKFDHHPMIEGKTRSAYRYTDIWIGQDHMIWGADDWLGSPQATRSDGVPFENRAGSRLFKTDRLVDNAGQLSLQDHGFVGNPVRSIIDIGEALIVTTEAKRARCSRPQVMLVSKMDPRLTCELFNIDVFDNRGTGFTFSRASRVAKDGTFFTFRSKFDLCDNPTRILKWKATY